MMRGLNSADRKKWKVLSYQMSTKSAMMSLVREEIRRLEERSPGGCLY